MTKDEFKAEFEGKKTTGKGAGPNRWFIPVIFEDDQWWGIDNKKNKCWDFYQREKGYRLYKEPEPAFDWEAEGFWGHRHGVYFFAKTSKWTWVRLGRQFSEGPYCKEEIIRDYQPCPKPDNASDYGAE